MIVSAVDVSKTYESDSRKLEVLKHIDFSVGQAQSISIMGRSGSGKSTLLSLLAGLDRPSLGDVLVEGQSWSAMSEGQAAEARAHTIGLIFQQFHLLPHLTALENISLPLELQRIKSARETARELLDQVGLGERSDHYPHQLSRGENQRVAIARALALKPKVLLADEPTASLDDETSEKMGSLLLSLPQSLGLSVVIATHDSDLASRCQLQWRIKQGRLEKVPAV